MLKPWCRILIRGSHLIGGYSTILDYRLLKLHCNSRYFLEVEPWKRSRVSHIWRFALNRISTIE